MAFRLSPEPFAPPPPGFPNRAMTKKRSSSPTSALRHRLRLGSKIVVSFAVFLFIFALLRLHSCSKLPSSSISSLRALSLRRRTSDPFVRLGLPSSSLPGTTSLLIFSSKASSMCGGRMDFQNVDQRTFSIYVHSKPSFIFDESMTRCPLLYGRQLSKSVEMAWGQSSMIEAEKLLLEEALEDPANQRFVLISDRQITSPSSCCRVYAAFLPSAGYEWPISMQPTNKCHMHTRKIQKESIMGRQQVFFFLYPNAKRVLAASNPDTQKNRPHTLFASGPATLPNGPQANGTMGATMPPCPFPNGVIPPSQMMPLRPAPPQPQVGPFPPPMHLPPQSGWPGAPIQQGQSMAPQSGLPPPPMQQFRPPVPQVRLPPPKMPLPPQSMMMRLPPPPAGSAAPPPMWPPGPPTPQ